MGEHTGEFFPRVSYLKFLCPISELLQNIQLDPTAAIRRLVESTFEYDEAHPGFIRLVTFENIHHARYFAASPASSSAATKMAATGSWTSRARANPGDVHTLAQYRDAGWQTGPHRVRPGPGAGKSQALHLLRALSGLSS
jgi:hypothetical protein